MEGIEHSATELAGDQGARYSSGGVAQDCSLRGRMASSVREEDEVRSWRSSGSCAWAAAISLKSIGGG